MIVKFLSSLSGLRYLEAFFGSLILVMVGMFGWMVSIGVAKAL
jgi:hypothetical protein